MKDGVVQTEQWTKAISFQDRQHFDEQARSQYTFTDSLDGKEHNGGWFRTASNFTLIIAPQAGHMVAASQVKMTQSYVSDLLTYGELRCDGKTCPTFASDMCDMMNNCNGNGVCSEETFGKCVCKQNWFGADCSVQVQELTKDFDDYVEFYAHT